MALSDILASLIRTINLTILADSSTISLTTAKILCKLGKFLWQCSYETSMLSLLVITIQKFIAVVFPMRARQEIAVRTRAWLIAFTWLVPAVVSSPCFMIFYYDDNSLRCKSSLNKEWFAVYFTFVVTVSTVLPLSIMLALYPVTIVKLVRQKFPGNGNSAIGAIRKKQNIRLTKMFVTIILVLFVQAITL